MRHALRCEIQTARDSAGLSRVHIRDQTAGLLRFLRSSGRLRTAEQHAALRLLLLLVLLHHAENSGTNEHLILLLGEQHRAFSERIACARTGRCAASSTTTAEPAHRTREPCAGHP